MRKLCSPRHSLARMLTCSGLAFAILAAGYRSPASASDTSSGETITFAAPVPLVSRSLPVFALRSPQDPTLFVRSVLRRRVTAPLVLENNQYIAREGNVLRSFVNAKTGDSVIIPDLHKTTTVGKNIQPALIARSLFAQSSLIPKDSTSYRPANEIQVFGGASIRPGSEATRPAKPNLRFTFVPAIRYAAGLPVYGEGSHLAVAIGRDGSLQGLVRRWHSASQISQQIRARKSLPNVRSEIISQLKPFQKNTAITVDRISTAYYDANSRFLQPVYRFTAILHPLGGRSADQRLIGYVPIGDALETLPSLRNAANQSSLPSAPPQQRFLQLHNRRQLEIKPSRALDTIIERPELKRLQTTGIPYPSVIRTTGGIGDGTISLGEYANRDGTMLNEPNQLSAGLGGIPFLPHNGPPIVRTQWYWAQPWEVDGPSSLYFMNSVNIAFTQPHGDWYLNTTLSNNADIWTIQQIGTNGNPGFGAAAGGKLATWIIDSCEVVPSFYDLQVSTGNGYNAFTPWFPVFQGLHNVLGFRTQMWLNDGLNMPFGLVAGLGGDVNAAWFQEIAADPNYNDGYTYLDSHLNQYVHMGRASTFIDARNLGQSIYDVYPQSASTTLWNFWMAN